MSTSRIRGTWSSTTCGGCATSSSRRARGTSCTSAGRAARWRGRWPRRGPATARRSSSSIPAVLELARRHLGLRRGPGLQGARGRRAGGAGRAAGRLRRRGARRRVRRRAGAAPPGHRRGAAPTSARRRGARGGQRGRRAAARRGGGDRRRAGRPRSRTCSRSGRPRSLARRRGGNVVLVGSRAPLPVERLRARLAADPSPAVVAPFATGGALPFRD